MKLSDLLVDQELDLGLVAVRVEQPDIGILAVSALARGMMAMAYSCNPYGESLL